MRAVAAVAALVAIGCIADRVLLFPPTRADATPYSQRIAGVEVIVAGSQPEPRGYVLRFYGNAMEAFPTAVDEAKQLPGVELWGVNWPGFGASPGKPRLANVAASSTAVFRALVERADGKPIVVIGTSMGAVAALHVAAGDHERRIAGVVLHNPPPLEELIVGRYGWWNLWLGAMVVSAGIPCALDSIANAQQTRAPALFVSSRDDGVVPIRYQVEVMTAYGGPWQLITIPGGHNAAIPRSAQHTIDDHIARWMTAR